MTKAEICRAISERLGWKFGTRDECTPNYPDEWLGQTWWFEGAPYAENELPNYYESEEASARLLEAMLVENTGIDIQHWSDSSRNTVILGKPFCVTLDACVDGKRVEFEGRAGDRKTAIVLAACKWLGIESGEIS